MQLTKGCWQCIPTCSLWDLWWERPMVSSWRLVSCEEFSFVASGWCVGMVFYVFGCNCCNCAKITSCSWPNACKSTSCFCHNTTISSTFFFCRASNYSLHPCIIELSSMVVNLNVELLVTTINSFYWRKFHFSPVTSAKYSNQVLYLFDLLDVVFSLD